MSVKSKQSSSDFDLKKNNRPIIFLICLLIATALWFIKAMEKSYETTVALPVKYTNIPRNNVLVNPPPSKLDVKIKAHGFTLLRHKIGLSINPIHLNIKPFANNDRESRIKPKFFILSDKFINQISDQINQDITVLDISPDTLNFQYDILTEKTVPVTSRVDAICQNQYFISDTVTITPATIKVRGPVAIIDTLTSISTNNVKFNDLTSSVHSIVQLEKNSQLEYSASKVTIDIPVSQYTEYNGTVAISVLNKPDNFDLIIFPGKISISCLIAFDKFKDVKESDFEAVVDYNDIKNNIKLLSVKINKHPEFIKSLKIQPVQVEYIIKQK